MLKRKIEEKLNAFKSHKKGLLITGARQVGKTYSVIQYGKANFKVFVRIDFIEDVNARTLFTNATDAETIISRLTLLVPELLIPGETLVFFDEVQKAPEIVTAIKYLVEDGRFRYILSGSLLGVELENIQSIPAGYVERVSMYPMDFEEFMIANGVAPSVIDSLRKSFEERTPVDEFIHERLLALHRLYMIVGGMPAAVNEYVTSKDLRRVRMEQDIVLDAYKVDIKKYDKENSLYIKEIFDILPSELNNKNKRFILKNLNENKRFDFYRNSFIWLADAGVAIPVYNVEEPNSPLTLSKSRNLLKLFSNDVGLLSAMFGDLELQVNLLSGSGNANYGSVYENFAAEELKAHGFEMYYYNSKAHGEVDFIVEYKGHAIPIEIKSGKDYKRHRALNNILDIQDYDIEDAFVFSNANVARVGKVTYYPIYMIGFLTGIEPTESLVYEFDLGPLAGN